MLEFQWPWMLLLLPAPLLVRRFLRPVESLKPRALRVPFIKDFIAGQQHSRRFLHWLALLLGIIGWILLVTALTKPVWTGDPVTLPVNARNLILAVDLSGSMQQRDFSVGGTTVSRLAATKKVASDFIARRKGDRIGLILFGDQAYLQAPLTLDRATVSELLNEAVLGLAGERTAIGDAIGLAVKRTLEHPEQEYVMILMTDGAATAGVSVAEATRVAAQSGLKIYTVGIGSRSGGGFFGNRSDLDEETLVKIANNTGGRYFRAHNTREFESIYEELDLLEPIAEETETWRPQSDLFHWPLAISFVLLTMTNLIRLKWHDD